MRKELRDFKLFSRKCLDRTHACQIFFRDRVQGGIFFTDFLIDNAQFFLHDNRNRSAEEHRRGRNQRQFPIQHVHTHEHDARMIKYLN